MGSEKTKRHRGKKGRELTREKLKKTAPYVLIVAWKGVLGSSDLEA